MRDASASALAATSGALTPSWAQGRSTDSATVFDLTIGETPFAVDGRRAVATTINGGVPGPLLRWREGDEVVLRVTNALDADTSLHWHGILLPNSMDGAPRVTFDGVAPGETFIYRFPIRQTGTYWYHSHSRFQEQTGVYGPIIIDPASGPRMEADREHVIVLSDWSFESPERIYANLKRQPDYYNHQRRTFGDFLRDASDQGLGAAIRERRMWAGMRMTPTDIADVTGATYTYLMNGASPGANWTALLEPGERVRLRFINASAMTFFDVRIPGLPMTVVAADGIDIEPVETDEFRIGVAETYDVIVAPPSDQPFTIFAESMDRSGFARGTLATVAGVEAAVPALRPSPVRSMADMGHDMGDMDREMAGGEMDHAAMEHGAPAASSTGMDHGAMAHAGAARAGAMAEMDHAEHGMASASGMEAMATAAPADDPVRSGPGVAMRAAMATDRLEDPGVGLGADGWRVLTYAQLRGRRDGADARAPERTLELHLTSNMERYMWSFDGVRFSEVSGPIELAYGERVRLTLVNDTMMEHPIHLHGMFVELDNGAGARRPLKHTVNIKPAERLSLILTADEPGDWAFHCHLLYHMEAGMMRVVRVAAPGPRA